MNTDALKILLENIRDGEIDVEDGISKLRNLSYIDLGCAKLDTHRELRVGYPEVIFCSGKTNEQNKNYYPSHDGRRCQHSGHTRKR